MLSASMSEPRYLLMALIDGFRWRAVEWPGIGRVLTRPEAEFVAEQTVATPRFLLPDDGVSTLALRAGDVLVLAAGQSPWDLGEPLLTDLRAVLRAAAAAPSAEPLPPPLAGLLPVRIDAVLEIATRWLGAADAHVLEAAFDALMFDVGGQRRDGDPALYLVPITALGLS
jgi:hypothetical protein